MKAGDDKNRKPFEPNLFTKLASQSDQVNTQFHAMVIKDQNKKIKDSFRDISNTIQQHTTQSVNHFL